jgi:hypothetical protein
VLVFSLYHFLHHGRSLDSIGVLLPHSVLPSLLPTFLSVQGSNNVVRSGITRLTVVFLLSESVCSRGLEIAVRRRVDDGVKARVLFVLDETSWALASNSMLFPVWKRTRISVGCCCSIMAKNLPPSVTCAIQRQDKTRYCCKVGAHHPRDKAFPFAHVAFGLARRQTSSSYARAGQRVCRNIISSRLYRLSRTALMRLTACCS